MYYSSSGTVFDGEVGMYRSTRTLQNEIPSGEQLINDIIVNKNGSRLYTAAGNSVKIWDLKQYVFKCLKKVKGFFLYYEIFKVFTNW